MSVTWGPSSSDSASIADWVARVVDGLSAADMAERGSALDRPALVALLAALHRVRPEATDVIDETRQLLAAERARVTAARVEAAEAAEPLRARILAELAEGPLRTRDLRARLGVPDTSISRVLRGLRDETLVVNVPADGSDGRSRPYALTTAGALARRAHATFGPVAEPWDPERESVPVGALRETVARAVRTRRQAHSLIEASAAFQNVIDVAAEHGLESLERRARFEQLVTLRQAAERSRWRTALAALTSMRGTSALAYREYETGRGFDLTDPAERVRSLTRAAVLFAALQSQDDRDDEWSHRHAQALFGIADVCRQATQYEHAVVAADLAARKFTLLDDDYGLANCAYLVGFCLRLAGRFTDARYVLDFSRQISAEGGFDRILANALVQLAETARVQGDHSAGLQSAQQAIELSGQLGMPVTLGFGHSSLGAFAFDAEDFSTAATELGRAEELLQHHTRGLALTLRRQATLSRTSSAVNALVDGGRRAIRAQELYASLHSPAGIAGCWIEVGRIELARSGKLSMQELLRRSVAAAPRRIVEDPWVGPELAAFVDESDDSTVRSAVGLLPDAQRFDPDFSFLRERVCLPDVDAEPVAISTRMAGESREVTSLDQFNPTLVAA